MHTLDLKGRSHCTAPPLASSCALQEWERGRINRLRDSFMKTVQNMGAAELSRATQGLPAAAAAAAHGAHPPPLHLLPPHPTRDLPGGVRIETHVFVVYCNNRTGDGMFGPEIQSGLARTHPIHIVVNHNEAAY